MRILVVDDDPVLRRIVQAGLTRAGHEVRAVADGHAAWELLQQESFRLVITDWMMPGMDGPELVGRIRAASFPGYTYIILLTAKTDKSDVVSGLDAGADDFLTKPFNSEELRARVAIGERILDLEGRLSEARDQLEVLATVDALTGLLNRRAIQERAEAEVQRAARDGTPLSFVMLDIDHFKSVNDTHGHLVGDQALSMVARVLAANKRVYDYAGRWGGEEFLLILPRTELTDARMVAERIRASIAGASLDLPDGGRLSLRISLGVTTAPSREPLALHILLQQADDALYHAKHTGRDRVEIYTASQAPPTLPNDTKHPDLNHRVAS
jgi:diguanylate cyclase (GGDEF)-like protein